MSVPPVATVPPSLLVRNLRGLATPRPPLWLMRQAGRYLPEYRAVRAQFPDFIQFCLTPAAAAEVTLQPITRFDLDAAIIFADILTIPHALGHTVTFSTGHGPHVEKLTHPAQLAAMQARLADVPHALAPVAETLRLTRAALPSHKAVIGFSGAPWTLACYLFGDKPSQGCPPTLLRFQQEHPAAFTQLIDLLTDACIVYLHMQARAGADVLQVFDSWAGNCPPGLRDTAVQRPLLRLAAALAQHCPQVPVILFPRQLPPAALQQLVAALPVRTGLSLDTTADLAWAARTLAPAVTLQGNLDPTLMTCDDPAPLAAAVHQALTTMHGKPYILNLGHGLTPETRIARVQQLADLVRASG